MKMIPPFILSIDKTPTSEKRVFDLLKRIGLSGAALHSLNIKSHPSLGDAEADFVIVSRFGLLVLEVKGGRVSQSNGIWTSTDGKNIQHDLKRSPFVQAKDAAYAIRNDIARRCPFRFRFGHGVLLPDSGSLPVTPEYSEEQYCTAVDCRAPGKFETWLNQLQQHWRTRVGGADLSDSQVDGLVRELRPAFEASIPVGHIAREGNKDIRRFSQEQFEALDEIEDNDRIICRGGAGTGKTFLLIEVAKRELAEGRSVLACARSPKLVDWIRTCLDEESWKSCLTVCGMSELESIPDQSTDVVLIDEGQDLLNLDVLAEVDRILAGGLEEGRWRWFMDDQNQAGFYAIDEEARQLLEHRGVTRKRLVRNCRNTSQIVRFTENLTGADIGRTQVEGRGLEPEVVFTNNASEECGAITDCVRSWLSEQGVVASQIVVLLADAVDSELLSDSMPGGVAVKSIADFKGMECDFVVVAGFDEEESNLAAHVCNLYTGLTRARINLRLVVPEVLRLDLQEQMMQNLKARG